MKNIILIFCISFYLSAFAQNKNSNYNFTPIYDIETSQVKSQGKTGTCWSFSTSSFLENEVKRITGKTKPGSKPKIFIQARRGDFFGWWPDNANQRAYEYTWAI